MVSFLQWGANFIKYVQRNPEVSSIKSFVGIQLHPNWLNACNLRFASNVGFYVANQTLLIFSEYSFSFFLAVELAGLLFVDLTLYVVMVNFQTECTFAVNISHVQKVHLNDLISEEAMQLSYT